MTEDLTQILKRAHEHEPIIINSEVLRSQYLPEALPHRDEAIRRLTQVWSVLVRGTQPANTLLIGKSGTGKTAVVRYVSKRVQEYLKNEVNLSLAVYYMNAQHYSTVYKATRRLCELSGFPRETRSTSDLFRYFLDKIAETNSLILLILDEIDMIAKAQVQTSRFKPTYDLLYNLYRINEFLVEKKSSTRVSICGITNDFRFKQYLDPRVLSSLGSEEIPFNPYNAEELRDILGDRMKLALRNEGKGCFSEGAVNLIAALSAQTGDARHALELLRTSTELSDQEQQNVVTLDHVKAAEDLLEEGKIRNLLETLPIHHKLIVASTLKMQSLPVYPADLYDVYTKLCDKSSLAPLSSRRVNQITNELDETGILSKRLTYFRQGGRKKQIQLACDRSILREVMVSQGILPPS